MIRHEFRAMGTTVAIHTNGDPGQAKRFVDASEARFSRFLPGSELTTLHTHVESRSSLSSDMFDLLSSAAEARRRTDGLVDIGVGAAMDAWGYDRPFDEDLTLATPPEQLQGAKWSLTGRRLTMPEGVALDLGGIAKGWVCDRLVDTGLAEIASAGGDIRSADPDLVVDVEAGSNLIEVPLGVGALATSSTLLRTWQAGSRTVSHLIDPHTMEPTDSPIVSSTVVAASAVEAEAGAKSVLLRGIDGLAWADEQPWIRRAVAVWRDGSVFSTKERVKAWS